MKTDHFCGVLETPGRPDSQRYTENSAPMARKQVAELARTFKRLHPWMSEEIMLAALLAPGAMAVLTQPLDAYELLMSKSPEELIYRKEMRRRQGKEVAPFPVSAETEEEDGEEQPVAVIIYFIRIGTEGPIKIGKTTDVKKRLGALQTGHPDQLSVVGTLMGDEATEIGWHNRFAAFRRRGEWFEPSPELLAAIAALPHPQPVLTPHPTGETIEQGECL